MAVIITGLSGLIYATVQQNIRQSADDPQIQMAEDTAAQLANGQQAQNVVPMQAAEQPAQHGGFFSHFGGGGLGQAVVTGVGMGAGFGLADAAIGSIFC